MTGFNEIGCQSVRPEKALFYVGGNSTQEGNNHSIGSEFWVTVGKSSGLNEVYSSEIENQKQDMEHSTSYYVFSTPLMK